MPDTLQSVVHPTGITEHFLCARIVQGSKDTAV